MPIKLSALQNRSTKLTVTTLDEQGAEKQETLTIKYKALTPKLLASWDSLSLGIDKTPLAERLADAVLGLAASDVSQPICVIGDQLPPYSSVLPERGELVAKFQKTLTDFADARGKSVVVDQLTSLLLDLDLVDEADQPIPPTRECLESCDLGFLNQVVAAINAATFLPKSVVAKEPGDEQ